MQPCLTVYPRATTMIAVYAALAIAAMNLPFSFGQAEPIRPPIRLAVPAPKLDLPEVERLEIVIPLPQRSFDDTLPRFIDQPTPLLEMIIPQREPSAQVQRSRYQRHPAAPTRIDSE